MTGGKFEVANRSDFSDARTIHIIKTTPGPYYHTVPVKLLSAYRYIRYVSPVGGFCNVSILEFYDENNEKIQGTAIGTAKTWNNTTLTYDKPFDGDVDTFFDAADDSSWTRLDFGEPRRISKIRFLPRTDGNGIYEGHDYVLRYWNGNQWQPLGVKTADSHILQYELPENALFLLKNTTKDRMYKTPAIIKNGEQKWF